MPSLIQALTRKGGDGEGECAEREAFCRALSIIFEASVMHEKVVCTVSMIRDLLVYVSDSSCKETI